MPAFFAALLDAGAAAEHDQVGERDLLAAGRRLVELALDAFQRLEHLRQLRRLVRFPVLLRRETNAGAVRAAALVRAAEGGRRRPGRRNQLRDGQARSQDLGLERGDVLVVDQLVVDRRDRVLPDQLFLGDLRAEIARARTHVAVRQLEPGAGERVRELVRVLHEAARDLLVGRVEAQREVGGQHRRRDALRLVVRIGHRARARAVLRLPLMRAGRALRQLPVVVEQVLEVVAAPLRRRRGPGDFQAAADGVAAHARLEAARPAEALRLDLARLRIGPLVRLGGGTVGLAEGVAAGDQRDRLLVVHRHALEGLADVPGRGHRVRVAVRALRVDVDQAHLHGAERVLEVAVAGVALVLAATRSPCPSRRRDPAPTRPRGRRRSRRS